MDIIIYRLCFLSPIFKIFLIWKKWYLLLSQPRNNSTLIHEHVWLLCKAGLREAHFAEQPPSCSFSASLLPDFPQGGQQGPAPVWVQSLSTIPVPQGMDPRTWEHANSTHISQTPTSLFIARKTDFQSYSTNRRHTANNSSRRHALKSNYQIEEVETREGSYGGDLEVDRGLKEYVCFAACPGLLGKG